MEAKQMPRRGGALLLLWSMILCPEAWAVPAGPRLVQTDQPQDACPHLLGQKATHVRRILEERFMHRFPVTAQLAEGNARLSALSVQRLDCERQSVVVSGTYEFRGHIGVIDVTRRGTAVMQLRLTPDAAQRQVHVGEPEVLDITFYNPAPWFDGQAIRHWALELFATPLCASLQHGEPC